MLESHVIQMKDFENVGEGTSTGFQVSVRCPYYRGIWASLLEGAEVTVDKAGGLQPGLHDVEVAVTWRWSYIPVEMQPTTHISNRKLVLVR